MPLRSANISWQAGQPRSADFGDIYFSEDGIAETLRVFIEPSDILAMVREQPQLCIGELGFGTGLNFAVCAREVMQRSSVQLHFVAFEKYPLTQQDWQRVFAWRGSALPVYAELRRNPLPVLPGWHQRTLAAGRIVLSVYHGDVASGLADLTARQRNPVDAWFLDGFAPAKNPSMWRPENFHLLARMSRQGTTISTFTAAGAVRRGLQAAGFTMRRVDQQPYKRESLAGVFARSTTRKPQMPPTVVKIHGAGIGGACMARHLAEQNTPVQVYDPAGVARGASVIDAAVMHCRLLGDSSTDAELRVSAFHYASNYLQRFEGLLSEGVLQVQGPNLDARKLARIARAYDAGHSDQSYWIQHLDQTRARQLSATQVQGDALLFPTAGVIDLPLLCARLLEHPQIEVIRERADFALDQCNVVCSGSSARQFNGCDWLEITDVHGQLDWFATPPLAKLPVIGNGYLVPTDEGCALGATYENTPWPAADATAHNLKLHAHYLADAGLETTDLRWLRRARGARAVTSDRVPLIGKFEMVGAQQQQWIATAFGSMGTSVAPLAAAMVTNEILGWMSPVSAEVQAAVLAERFRERQARRGVRGG